MEYPLSLGQFVKFWIGALLLGILDDLASNPQVCASKASVPIELSIGIRESFEFFVVAARPKI